MVIDSPRQCKKIDDPAVYVIVLFYTLYLYAFFVPCEYFIEIKMRTSKAAL